MWLLDTPTGGICLYELYFCHPCRGSWQSGWWPLICIPTTVIIPSTAQAACCYPHPPDPESATARSTPNTARGVRITKYSFSTPSPLLNTAPWFPATDSNTTQWLVTLETGEWSWAIGRLHLLGCLCTIAWRKQNQWENLTHLYHYGVKLPSASLNEWEELRYPNRLQKYIHSLRILSGNQWYYTKLPQTKNTMPACTASLPQAVGVFTKKKKMEWVFHACYMHPTSNFRSRKHACSQGVHSWTVQVEYMHKHACFFWPSFGHFSLVWFVVFQEIYLQ